MEVLFEGLCPPSVCSPFVTRPKCGNAYLVVTCPTLLLLQNIAQKIPQNCRKVNIFPEQAKLIFASSRQLAVWPLPTNWAAIARLRMVIAMCALRRSFLRCVLLTNWTSAIAFRPPRNRNSPVLRNDCNCAAQDGNCNVCKCIALYCIVLGQG